LSIITSKLLDPKQKSVMANVYKIMDKTGDGRLSWKEIKAGF
jgi:hypothetical protein